MSATHALFLRRKRWLGVIMAAAVVVFASGTAARAATTFFGEDQSAGASLPVPNSDAAQADFLSHLTGVRVEDFEGITNGTDFPFNVTFGSDTATLSGSNNISRTGVSDSTVDDLFPISGDQHLYLGVSDSGSFTLEFSAPQAAFGFYGTDIGDIDGQLALSFDGGPNVNVPHTVDGNSGSALFFGIIDTANPFSKVEFKNTTGTRDAFGFDDFTIGRADQVTNPPEPNPVPTPSAAIAGMVLLGGLALRRRRHA